MLCRQAKEHQGPPGTTRIRDLPPWHPLMELGPADTVILALWPPLL